MDAFEQMYQEIILEEYGVPYNKVYAIDDPNQSHQYNPSCGDDITVAVTISNNIIMEMKWAGEGCSISLASASILAKLVEGKSNTETRELVTLFKKLMNSKGKGIDDSELDRLADASVFLGTSKFPARIKCALLGWVAFEGAVANVLSETVSSRDGCGISSAHSSHVGQVDGEPQ